MQPLYEAGRDWRNTRGAIVADHHGVTESRREVYGDYGLLVLLARLGIASALYVLGRKLRMNPDRISKIYVTMVRWMRQATLGGLLLYAY
jgi:hypothetical protein